MFLFEETALYRFGGTCFFAQSASDTFCIIGVFYRVAVHFAGACACAAVNTAFFVYPVAEYRHRLEDRVDGSQRTDIFAEGTVDQNGQQYCEQKEKIFPCIKPSQSAVHSLIQKYMRNTALKRAGRTDELTEPWRTLSEKIGDYHGQQDHKQDENHILKLS